MIKVSIVSAEVSIYDGEGSMVFAPGSEGELGIAPNHTPLLTELKSGEVRVIDSKGEEKSFFVSGGILEVQPNVITVLSDTVVRAHDLDEAKALEAKEKAEKILSEKSAEVSYAEAMSQLQNAIAQINAISRLKKIKN